MYVKYFEMSFFITAYDDQPILHAADMLMCIHVVSTLPQQPLCSLYAHFFQEYSKTCLI